VGFFEEQRADGSIRRGETYTCCHCNNVHEYVDNVGKKVVVNGCGMCQKPVCPACHKVGTCTPFEKKLDRIEARDKLFREAGIVG
jgi:hypothetical protein